MKHPKPIKLSLYRDDMLDDKSKRDIQDHLLHCEKCHEQLKEWDWIADQARQVVDFAVPAQFQSQIIQRIRKHTKTNFWDQFILLPGMWKPAVAVIAICLIFFSHQMTHKSQQSLEISTAPYSLWTGPMDEPALTKPEQALVIALNAPLPQSGE